MKNIDGIKLNTQNLEPNFNPETPKQPQLAPEPDRKKANSSFSLPNNPINDNYFSSEYYSKESPYQFKVNRTETQIKKCGFPWKKVIIIASISLASFLLLYFGFFSLKARSVTKKINIENRSSSLFSDMKALVAPIIGKDRKKLNGEEAGRINILLLGAAGENKPGRNLTDTVMLMSIDTKNRKMGLLSLPRDLYVNIPETKKYTKINSLYQIGLNENRGIDLIKTGVEKITEQPIHYYFVVDFQGFEKVIDDLGGINVEVARDIYDTRYPGPNYSYETFELKKGWQQLDGKTALKYVRERHDDPEGDFGRAKRQQQVLQTVKNKAFSIGTILNPVTLNSILNELEKNIKTNITFDEIESFIALSKEVDTQNISNKVADAWKKDSLLKVSHVFYGNTRAFVLVPRAGNFSEIADIAKNIFDQEENEKRLKIITDENAVVEIRNESEAQGLGGKIREFLATRTGFRDIKITSSTEQRQTTEVFDCTLGAKIFSLDEIVKKIPAKLNSDQSKVEENCSTENGTNSDLVLLLGNDVSKHYLMEESTVTELDNSEDSQEITIFEQ